MTDQILTHPQILALSETVRQAFQDAVAAGANRDMAKNAVLGIAVGIGLHVDGQAKTADRLALLAQDMQLEAAAQAASAMLIRTLARTH